MHFRLAPLSLCGALEPPDKMLDVRPNYPCHYSWFLLTHLRDPSQSTACELHHSFRFNSFTFQLELPVEDKHPFLLIMIPLSALESEPRVRLWLIGKNGYSGKWWIVTNRDMYGLRIKPTLSPGGHYLISSGNAQHADTLSVFCSGWLTPVVRWPQLGFLRPVSGRPTLWKTFVFFYQGVIFSAGIVCPRESCVSWWFYESGKYR